MALPTRRRFLQQAGGAAAFGLADLSAFQGLATGFEQGAPPADMIRFGADIEPWVRLIEETPRNKCVAVFVDKLRGGLPYRQFLTAIFLACIRKQDSHHNVYLIHSAHQVSLDVRPEERLIPLFWALDHYKWQQEKYGTPALKPFTEALPSAEKAAAEFHDAMQGFDRDKAERAIVAMSRTLGPQQTMEQLWPYGCRDVSFIGHRAISVASCWRAMETLGWQHAEPVLRFVVRDLYFSNGKQDAYYRPNMARVDQHLAKLTPGWSGTKADRGATVELVGLIREGKGAAACDLAMKQLVAGTSAQAIWDAVHLAVAELMVRPQTGALMRPLHANTSANALHYAFGASASARTRLLVLLQAVAWAADFTQVEIGRKSLRDLKITDLAGAAIPASVADAVTDIFATLPSRAGEKVGNRAAQDEAGRKAFALAQKHPEATPLYTQAALSWLCMKADVNAHEYKYPAAIFEDVGWVSPEWRPHILSSSVHWLHGKQSPDSVVLQQAREALRAKG